MLADRIPGPSRPDNLGSAPRQGKQPATAANVRAHYKPQFYEKDQDRRQKGVNASGWQMAETNFDANHSYRAHLKRNASLRGNAGAAAKTNGASSLKRQNAVRLNPFRRLKRFFVRAWRTHLMRSSSKSSFHFTRRYLLRKQSFIVTPDISTLNFRFRKRDMVKKRPRPDSWQSARQIKTYRGAEAVAMGKNPHGSYSKLYHDPDGGVPEVLRDAGDASGPDAHARAGSDALTHNRSDPHTSKDDSKWAKVSLPVRQGHSASNSSDSEEKQRELARARAAQPAGLGILGGEDKRGTKDSTPRAISDGEYAPERTDLQSRSREDLPKRYSALLPRVPVGPDAVQIFSDDKPANDPYNQQDIVDVTAAMDFVGAWSAYLRRAIAMRAVLRREIEHLEVAEEEKWKRQSRFSRMSYTASESGSYYSVSSMDISDDDQATVHNRAGPSESRYSGIVRAGPELSQESLRSLGSLGTFGSSSSEQNRESQAVVEPTLRSITHRYSNLFGEEKRDSGRDETPLPFSDSSKTISLAHTQSKPTETKSSEVKVADPIELPSEEVISAAEVSTSWVQQAPQESSTDSHRSQTLPALRSVDKLHPKSRTGGDTAGFSQLGGEGLWMSQRLSEPVEATEQATSSRDVLQEMYKSTESSAKGRGATDLPRQNTIASSWRANSDSEGEDE